MAAYFAAIVVIVAVMRLAWFFQFLVLAMRTPDPDKTTGRARLAKNLRLPPAVRSTATAQDQRYDLYKTLQTSAYTLGGLALAAWAILASQVRPQPTLALSLLTVTVLVCIAAPVLFRSAGGELSRLGYESSLAVGGVALATAMLALGRDTLGGSPMTWVARVVPALLLIRDGGETFAQMTVTARYIFAPVKDEDGQPVAPVKRDVKRDAGTGGWSVADGLGALIALAVGLVITYMAAVAIFPFTGTTVLTVVGIAAVVIVNVGLGALLVGAYLELAYPEWSRLGALDCFVLVGALALSAAADALFGNWLYGSTSSWLVAGFTVLAVVSLVSGGLLSSWRLWPMPARPAGSDPPGAETAVTESAVTESAVTESAVTETAVTETAVTETAVTETAVARDVPFLPMSILIGLLLGCATVVLVLGGFAWADNNIVGPAPVVPEVAPIGGDYVVPGDSYSAGEGLRPFLPGTAETGCDRSASHAYGEVLAATQHWHLTFIACSGGVISDVYGPRGDGRVAAQITSGAHPDVKLVTMTIGGNNVDFAKVVQRCFSDDRCLADPFPPGPPDVTGSEPGVAQQPLRSWAGAQLLAVRDDEGRFFARMRNDFQHARIVIIGYPYLFPDGDASVYPPNCYSVLRRVGEPVRRELRSLEDQLNNAIYEEAAAHGIEFVSPKALWRGHEPCGSKGQWTNSLKPYLDFEHPIDGGSFHPNLTGQKAIAALVACYLDTNPVPPRAVPSGPIPAGRLVGPDELALPAAPGDQAVLPGCQSSRGPRR